MVANRQNKVTPSGILLLVGVILLVIRCFTLSSVHWIVMLSPLLSWLAWVVVRTLVRALNDDPRL